MSDKFSNIKPEKRYKRISNGDVFTGQQLRNLLDVQETTEAATRPGEKYGVNREKVYPR